MEMVNAILIGSKIFVSQLMEDMNKILEFDFCQTGEYNTFKLGRKFSIPEDVNALESKGYKVFYQMDRGMGHAFEVKIQNDTEKAIITKKAYSDICIFKLLDTKKSIPLLDQIAKILPMKYRNATNDNILLEPIEGSSLKELDGLNVNIKGSFEKMRGGRRHWIITNDNNEQVNIIKERYSNDYIVTVG